MENPIALLKIKNLKLEQMQSKYFKSKDIIYRSHNPLLALSDDYY